MPVRLGTQVQALPRGTELNDPSPAAAAEAALRRGDFLAAYDVAISAREAGDETPRLAFIAALALARMGDSDLALALYERTGLGAIDNDEFRALEARIKKDIAQRAPAAERETLFGEASRAYRAIFDELGGYFSAINAATTALLAGQDEAARSLAALILGDPEIEQAESYYAAASAAEAHVLLGDGEAAAAATDIALGQPDADAGSRASTFRQFELIAHYREEKAAIIAPLLARLRPQPIAVFTGHMFVQDEAAERRVADRVARALDDLGSAIAYGSLACGADILVAEAMLVRGGELNVVLPFRKDDFVAQSVTPGGGGWLARFENCLAAATNVSFASDVGFVGDPTLFSYGSSIKMGLARMRAAHLNTEAVQLAVLTDGGAVQAAGTASDVAAWRRLGGRTITVDPGEVDRGLEHPAPIAISADAERAAHSMIFADFEGFSKLPEAALPLFVSDVAGKVGAVLDEFGDTVLYRNSWGDAFYAVIATPVAAAEIALSIQHALKDIPEALKECAEHCGMRIGVHHGPIYRGYDAVMRRPSFYGTEVTRTARIEPVTPTGEVYATEAFAAMLALESERRYGTHYVGRIQLAKGYGELAMYKLSRQAEAATISGAA